jgi:hypothetical protein
MPDDPLQTIQAAGRETKNREQWEEFLARSVVWGRSSTACLLAGAALAEANAGEAELVRMAAQWESVARELADIYSDEMGADNLERAMKRARLTGGPS